MGLELAIKHIPNMVCVPRCYPRSEPELEDQKDLGLLESTDEDEHVINVLIKNHEYKEKDSEHVKIKGKRGSIKNNLC